MLIPIASHKLVTMSEHTESAPPQMMSFCPTSIHQSTIQTPPCLYERHAIEMLLLSYIRTKVNTPY